MSGDSFEKLLGAELYLLVGLVLEHNAKIPPRLTVFRANGTSMTPRAMNSNAGASCENTSTLAMQDVGSDLAPSLAIQC